MGTTNLKLLPPYPSESEDYPVQKADKKEPTSQLHSWSAILNAAMPDYHRPPRSYFGSFIHDYSSASFLATDSRSVDVPLQRFKRFLVEFPVIDGAVHPGEEALVKAYALDPLRTGQFIIDLFAETFASSPQVAARLLGVVSGVELPMAILRTLSLSGLLHPDIQVRDAAISLLEVTPLPNKIDILRGFHAGESSPWLKTYVESLIKQLGE